MGQPHSTAQYARLLELSPSHDQWTDPGVMGIFAGSSVATRRHEHEIMTEDKAGD